LLLAALLLAPASRGGDILRGGATPASGRKNAEARGQSGAETANVAKATSQDRLARTTQAINAVRAMQQGATAAAFSVPDGLAPGGLQLATGANARLDGALAPVAGANSVTIKQTKAQAILHWETFNVGRNTTLQFDQSEGKSDTGKWIAFNKVFDPAGVPSKILGSIKADGQVYIINQNGIIFGVGSQINTRTLVASSLAINDNLVERGLLNQAKNDVQFLFKADSAVSLPAGDVIVETGAAISSPVAAEGSGGRIMLVGNNVANEGTLSAPAGQIILAAGSEIGFEAHSSNDPSLRGLDVFIGNVRPSSGTVMNSGLVSVLQGNLTLAGKTVQQFGAVESTTTTSLNGRLDFDASYGAVINPQYDPVNTSFGTPFFKKETGIVTFGPLSVTRILPDTSDSKTIVGLELPIRSQINITGRTVYFDYGSMMLAPNANVAIKAGVWNLIPGSGSSLFVFSEGQIYLNRDAFVDVAGTTDVFVPLSQSVFEVQLRGPELADSPLQRTGALRGSSLTIDTRKGGVYQGKNWVGTPLGDASGFVDLIERNADQLTVTGGTITMQAGNSIVLQPGSSLDVSGGYVQHEAGRVRTTRLVRGGRLIDIADATPDQIYDGIFTDQVSESHTKWGITRNYSKPLAPTGEYNDPGSLEGAGGGTLSLTASAMALDGEMRGKTVIGPRQLRESENSSNLPEYAKLNLSFRNQLLLPDGSTSDASSTPPTIVFGSTPLPSVEIFATTDMGVTPSLSEARSSFVYISPDLVGNNGFGSLSIDNVGGETIVPAGVKLNAPEGGNLSVSGANITIQGRVKAPGGTVQFTAYNLSPLLTPQLLIDPLVSVLPPPNPDAGVFLLGEEAELNVAGRITDDRITNSNPEQNPFNLAGGSVTVNAYTAKLSKGSVIDVSGGLGVTVRGKYEYGDGGKITISSGQDPGFPSLLGGKFEMSGELRGFSGATGGTLAIKAPQIRIGGVPVISNEILWLSPDFFSRGGFNKFEISGIGARTNDPTEFVPAILIAPGTIIEPVAQGLAYVPYPGRSGGMLEPVQRGVEERAPVSLAFKAPGVKVQVTEAPVNPTDLPLLPGDIKVRGDIVFSEGAKIVTDPLGKVSFDGQTVNVLGSISTPGGTIEIKGGSSFGPIFNDLEEYARTTVYIGPQSRLSAIGTYLPVFDKFNRRRGTILPGGTISISGNIVAEKGSVLDVSGASGILDLTSAELGQTTSLAADPRSGLTRKPEVLRPVATHVNSSGGSITLKGARLLFTEATLLGRSGGDDMEGGTLSISSGRFYGIIDLPTSADLNLEVAQAGSFLSGSPESRGLGQGVRLADGTRAKGMGYFAVSDFSSGGFDSLELRGNVNFVGPVAISARGKLLIADGGVIFADDDVDLAASYIRIGQIFRPPSLPAPAPQLPLFTTQSAAGTAEYRFAPTFGPGSLTVRAPWIDIGTLSLQNIGKASFKAAGGHIRGNGTVNIAGEITLEAAQVYVPTAVAFNIFAYDHATGVGSVTIRPSGKPDAILSAGGSINVQASIINQGGVLLAPFGQITLGWDGTGIPPSDPIAGGVATVPSTVKLTLDSGGITSVSGLHPTTEEPLLVPYGLSADGRTWIDPRGQDITAGGLLVAKRVFLSADSLVTETRSSIDIRGGGDLFAYQFISGNGGTVDILSPDPIYDEAQPSSFAVVPDYSAEAAPFGPYNPTASTLIDSENNRDRGYVTDGLEVGDRVQLGASSGLPAGVYTLLPARYALLPGAFMVTPASGNPMGTVQFADGSSRVSGFAYNSLNRSRRSPSVYSPFEVVPAAVLAQRAEYTILSANTFFPQRAAELELPEVARLPMDAGYLALQGNQHMRLFGDVQAAASPGGRGAVADISSFSKITLVDDDRNSHGGVILNTARLSGYGIESLLIGGLRNTSALATTVDVRAPSVTMDARGALTGPDVSLVAKEVITLRPGSQILATRAVTEPSRPFSIQGNGAAVRVTSDPAATIVRSGVSGGPTSLLVVGAGSRLSGASVTLDSSYGFALSESTEITATNLILGAGQISLLLNGPTALIGQIDPLRPQLVLSGNALANIGMSTALTLISYQNAIDLYGPGSFGSLSLKLLTLQTGALRGFNQGGESSTISAGGLSLSNPRGVTPPVPGAASGSLIFNVESTTIGSGDLTATGFAEVVFNSTSGILFEGSGGFFAQNALTANTPVLAVGEGAEQSFAALGGALTINKTSEASGITAGLGGALRLAGSQANIFADVLAPSGSLEIEAIGDIFIGGSLDTAGTSRTFYDITRYADGGAIRLTSQTGSILLDAASSVSVAANPGGGNAGAIQIRASQGQITALGTFSGQAGLSGRGGSFQLDAGAIASLDVLSDLLNGGSFTESRNIRARTGDLVVNGVNTVRNLTLSADAGSITVLGTIDASGLTGGRIALIARNDLTLQTGSLLTTAAQQFSNAGKGGEIYLEAGASSAGVIGLGTVYILAGSEINLSVAAFQQGATADPNGDFTDPSSSAFHGQFRGSLHIRAPRLGGNDIAIDPIAGSVVGASSILAEGYRIYDRTAFGGVMNIALRNQINTQSSAYITAFEAVNSTKLLGATINSGLAAHLVVAPGVEVINTSGDLTLGAENLFGDLSAEARSTGDWNLATFRYGAKRAPGVLTLRAQGNIVFNNALSDGFTAVTPTSANGFSGLWLAPLTPISLDINGDLYRPINTQSWSYKLAAGADFSAADALQVLSLDVLNGIQPNGGSVIVGELHLTVPNNRDTGSAAEVGPEGQTADNIRIAITDFDTTNRGTRFEVIRTGTGDIEIATGRDLQLRNQFATIYTAGVRLVDQTRIYEASDFALPRLNSAVSQSPLGIRQQTYAAQWNMAGGDIRITTQSDMVRYTADSLGNLIKDSSRQSPNNWLSRRGSVTDGVFGPAGIQNGLIDPAASTAWWIDFSNFFEGVGALGGGNIDLQAGGRIENIDAAIPTSARTPLGIPGSSPTHELGGGDLMVRSSGDIDGGIYYVERGNASLFAAGEITTNQTRSPSLGNLVSLETPLLDDPLTWLPTTFFLGKGSLSVVAQGNILAGPILNTFLMPQGQTNQFWYKTYFSTYAPDSSAEITSYGGGVTHRLAATLGDKTLGDSASPILFEWMRTQNVFQNSFAEESTSAYYHPWLRLAESSLSAFTSVDSFSSAFSLLPPTLKSTAFAGDINIVGQMTLAPSPTGTLELAASGAIQGLQTTGRLASTLAAGWTYSVINVSDADPANVPGLTTPISYNNFVGLAGTFQSDSATDTTFLSGLNRLFDESGSFSGNFALSQVKNTLHSPGPLHGGDTQPVRVYSGGDIEGLTLFTPKFTDIKAAGNITDIAFYIQNVSADQISTVSAGGNIVAYNENTLRRSVATDSSLNNFLTLDNRTAISKTATTTSSGVTTSTPYQIMSGDIQISGPGRLQVLAGGNLDLGNGPTFDDGTGSGLTSIGNLRNLGLPFDGASITAFAGLGKGLLEGTAINYADFIEKYVASGDGAALLGEIGEGLTLEEFEALTLPEQEAIALDAFFVVLRNSGAAAAESGSYEDGFAAIGTLFGTSSQQGDILTRSRDIRTKNGGDINLFAPGGELTLASAITGARLTPPGVVTEYGGAVSVFTAGDVDLGEARIFTLRGGDIIIWSSTGDIAAGTAAKTVQTAPPTRVIIDTQSAEVQTDLAGLATGGGIGVLATVAGVKPGDVFLIAPVGTVDAGDAGIRASGNITIAAAAVLNADNIAAAGSTVGVPATPTVAAPNIAGLSSAASSTGAANNAATQVANQARPEPTPEETPSIIAVEVLGYGGGDES